MADSSSRTLRWITCFAAASALCIFLGLPSAAFVGPMTSASTSRVLRSATLSAVQGEGEGDKDILAEGQEVTLLAPAALAGTKAAIVQFLRDGSKDESYSVRLPSGSVFNIPVQNMEISRASKSLSQALQNSSLKSSNLWSKVKASCGAIKRRFSQLFKKTGAGMKPTKKPDVKKASATAPAPAPAPAPSTVKPASQKEAPALIEEEQEEFFMEGQQVILLHPPALAGKPGIVVGATRGGDYAVQLASGSVFHIAKGSMKAARESGLGGGSGGVGGSGKGYGGGNGLPPRRTGSNRGEDEPGRSKGGRSALLVKLAVLVMLLCAIFHRPLRRMLRELHSEKPVAAILHRIDRRPASSAGSDIGLLIGILCLALYVILPQLLEWFKEHVVPLMSKAEAVVLSVQGPAEKSGSTMDKWIAMWPLAVLVLASILFTEKSKLPWRTGDSDDEEGKTSANQHSLKFDGLSLKDINQDLFKAELRQRLHENGVVRSRAEKLNIELRSGSVIAVLRGPADVLRSVKAIDVHKLRVMGIAPKTYKDHGPKEVRFETPVQESEENNAASEKQSYMVRRQSISRLPPGSDSQEASSVPADLEEFKAEIAKHDNKGFPYGSRARRRPIPFLSPVAEEDSGPVIGFEVEFKSDFGDRLLVVGDHRCHGEWEPEQTEVELFTDMAHYPIWSGFWKPKERSGLTHQYKLVVKKENGDFVWEAVENRKVCLSSNERWLVKLKFNDSTA
eukprot:TRINITY_DN9201_c0_g1_i1.p1 TRINITY_DN9201_c0_g1~~TRINITY_DN9201_c0_g1_i1.p1  ORF type:complete len:733 (+),score=137.10 TRINITY_DN9201_c0_g1_i1:117-2315(+)